MLIYYTLLRKKNFYRIRNNYDLHLNVDPLLLADAFENCRKESINYFELNPAH